MTLLTAMALPNPASQLHADQVYRWTDEHGTTHFGDKPPAGNADIIDIRSSKPSDPATAGRIERTNKLVEAFAEDRQEKQERRAAAEIERKERVAECARARTELEQLRTAQFVYSNSRSGERQILSFEGRAAAERAAADKVAELCRDSE